jgi:hypothetical protein
MGGIPLEDSSAFLLKRLCLCVLTDEFPRIGRSKFCTSFRLLHISSFSMKVFSVLYLRSAAIHFCIFLLLPCDRAEQDLSVYL